MSDTNKQIYYDGSVGIGTQDPSQRLDVNGKLRIGNDEVFPQPGTIRFSENSFQGFDGQSWESFTTAGNLAPQTQITIQEGDLRLQKNHVNDNQESWQQHLLFTDHEDRIGAKITGKREAWDGAPMGLAFHTGGANLVEERMTLTSEGKVGIGTMSPNTSLDINGLLTVGNEGDNCQILLNAANNKSATIGVQDDNDQGFYIRTGGEYRMSVNQNGKVGIGTTAPIYTLDVNGTFNAKSLHFKSQPFSHAGTIAHDNTIPTPSGTARSDWNVFVSPQIMGREETNSEGDNALIKIECWVDSDWKARARYKYRYARIHDASVWYSGTANYILVPK